MDDFSLRNQGDFETLYEDNEIRKQFCTTAVVLAMNTLHNVVLTFLEENYSSGK